jgi:hypothetical protein
VILKGDNNRLVCLRTVLRRISGPERYELIGGWRKLCDEELRNFYSSSTLE